MGNRLTKTDNVNGNETYTYNNANMLLTRNTDAYTHDANGNTLTGGGRTNTWDSQNRLAQCVNGTTTSTFTYGADGIRHRTVVQTGQGTPITTDAVLDGGMMIREMREGTAYATFLNGPRGPECRRDDTTGQVRWYIYDGLGSVVGEIDPAGNMTTTRSHDVYGLVRSSTGQRTSAHGFVGSLGHTSEDNTGLIYMRARYMDSVLGRFVSEDPTGNGLNWYIYCGNDPVNYNDASGKIRVPWKAIIHSYISSSINMMAPNSMNGCGIDFGEIVANKADEIIDKICNSIRKGVNGIFVDAAELEKGESDQIATDGADYVDAAQTGVSMISDAQNLADALEVLATIRYYQGFGGN